MSDSNTDTAVLWKDLRKPFPKEVMGLLPKVSCYSCSQATRNAKSALDKHCDRHKMLKCEGCGAYISEAHIHLDFVGHAAVTDRLNTAAGPENWVLEPLGCDEHGNPIIKDGQLWCWLTIRGARKLCVGDGASTAKELIGDAIRNGAMRFGVALDLWSKDELESTLDDPSLKNDKPTSSSRPKRPSRPTTAPDASGLATPTQKARITALLRGKGVQDGDMKGVLIEEYGLAADSSGWTKADAERVIEELQS